KFAPGALIVAVGRDPQRMGVNCGDDVCDAEGIYTPGRLDGILDRMRQPLRHGYLPSGRLEGTRAVGDPPVVREPSGSSDVPAWIGWLVGGLAAAGGLGAAVWAWVYPRRKTAATARGQFDEVQRDYGRVAQQL